MRARNYGPIPVLLPYKLYVLTVQAAPKTIEKLGSAKVQPVIDDLVGKVPSRFAAANKSVPMSQRLAPPLFSPAKYVEHRSCLI